MLRTKEVPYVYSRDGIFYFTRRIPNDLKVEPKITEEWTHPNDNKKRLEEYRTFKNS